MKAVALLCLVAIAGVAAVPETVYQDAFVNWMSVFDKTYSHDEFFARYNTFKYWVDFVALHNAGNNTWQAGLNQFSDLTPAQFSEQMLSGLTLSAEDSVDLPESQVAAEPNEDVDWRSKGAVQPVKNQGSCGSCWAFSAIGIVEGWGKIQKGNLWDLSEQQLVDCAGAYGNLGCRGGWHDKAVDYLAENGGSCVQKDYPYKAKDGQCQKTCKPVVTPKKSVKGVTEQALADGLTRGPVGVAVDASGGFQSYRSGVFSGPCGTQLNHAILAVGSSSSPSPHWIVKNSWGTAWGDKGYILMAKGKNLCGVNKHTVTIVQ